MSKDTVAGMSDHEAMCRTLQYAYESDEYEFENVLIGIVLDNSVPQNRKL